MGSRRHPQNPADPLILIVPGLNDSGPDHWQTHWENSVPGCERVDLGMWDKPHRNTWVNRLNLAIYRAGQPVVLVAHSLGCHAVAWWAEYEQPGPSSNVVGALLVAPPDVEQPGLDPRIARFGPLTPGPFPFPTILAASHNDPYLRFVDARRMAKQWGSHLVDAGRIGHINAQSDIGDWPFGMMLLDQLLPRPVRHRYLELQTFEAEQESDVVIRAYQQAWAQLNNRPTAN